MPEIGNPNQQANPFGKIQRYQGPDRGRAVNPNSLRDRNVGEVLNDIAGARQEKKFVDKDQHNKLDKDSFLKLLSAQLANQDPLKPMDQKKFAADMAQFAQLEQMTNMNQKLDKTAANNNQQLKFMGASFIGKSVHTQGTSVPYNGEDLSVNLPFYLPKPAQKVMVRVFDSSNNLIAQLEHESMGMGSNSLRWNGKQMDGTRAVKGDYRFDVQAWDDKYQSFKGETKAQGLVTGVTFENGETVLELDGKRKVALRDVDSFFQAKQKHAAAKSGVGLKANANDAYNKVKNNIQ